MGAMGAPRFAAEDWSRLEEAFERLRVLPDGERASALAALADWPAPLRGELAALLAAAARGGGAALEQPAFAALDFDLAGGGGPEQWLGTVLGGRWQIEALIASGGMGDVLRARRVVGDYEQTVAVKLLREGLQYGSLGRRFHAERQALASLQHPHVAKLLDGGETDHGVPWLAMEFVAGENLLAWAEARGLDARARARLMIPVCEALQHAHQRLLVHRDLKPGNILVTAAGDPVLLDFGVAKLLDPGRGDESPTQAARAPMTPEFASPEQARGEPVGTASDLWSLGVVMFRLFGGGKPYDADAVSGYELARRLSEQPLPRLRERAPGAPADLDAIVGKCLRVEPERRYPSAQALAEDLRRFLRGLPVSAQPDTFAYRARRFLRRNWAASLLGAAALAAAVGGALGVIWQRDLAVRRALTAERVIEFLVGLFRAPDPWAESLGQQSLEQILADGRRGLVDGLGDEPQVRSRLLAALGEVYRNLGAEEDALAILRDALAADPGLRAREPARWAELRFVLGVARLRAGDPEGAEEELRAALAVQERGGDRAALASTRNTLGVAVSLQEERGAEAEALYRAALGARLELFGPNHPEVATTLQNLAALELARGRVDAALDGFAEAALVLARAWPSGHPDRATELNNWGMALRDAERAAEAEARLREALAMRERLLPADHPHLAGSRYNLGLLRWDAGDYAGAAEWWRRALAGIAERAQAGHPLRAMIEADLAAAEAR